MWLSHKLHWWVVWRCYLDWFDISVELAVLVLHLTNSLFWLYLSIQTCLWLVLGLLSRRDLLLYSHVWLQSVHRLVLQLHSFCLQRRYFRPHRGAWASHETRLFIQSLAWLLRLMIHNSSVRQWLTFQALRYEWRLSSREDHVRATLAMQATLTALMLLLSSISILLITFLPTSAVILHGAIWF